MLLIFSVVADMQVLHEGVLEVFANNWLLLVVH